MGKLRRRAPPPLLPVEAPAAPSVAAVPGGACQCGGSGGGQGAQRRQRCGVAVGRLNRRVGLQGRAWPTAVGSGTGCPPTRAPPWSASSPPRSRRAPPRFQDASLGSSLSFLFIPPTRLSMNGAGAMRVGRSVDGGDPVLVPRGRISRGFSRPSGSPSASWPFLPTGRSAHSRHARFTICVCGYRHRRGSHR